MFEDSIRISPRTQCSGNELMNDVQENSDHLFGELYAPFKYSIWNKRGNIHVT